jgi:hypothetical protein
MCEKFPFILHYNDNKMNTKEDIKKVLVEIFQELDNYLKGIKNQSFSNSVNGKWSIAQNIDHLTVSNNITALSLNIPRPLLKQLFKTNQRVNWNYDEVAWKYQLQLSHGAKAPLPFQPRLSLIPIPSVIDFFWKKSCSNILKAVDNWSENDLDTYVVAHPILGKITVRELFFFTVYHTRHHLNTIKNIGASTL